MDDIKGVVTLVGSVLGIIGLASLAVAFFRASINKQTIELLRNDRDDANARADGIRDDYALYKEKAEAEHRRLNDMITSLEIKDSEKSQEILILRNVVTGKDQLDRIEKLLTRLAEGERI